MISESLQKKTTAFTLENINSRLSDCRKCPRLVDYIAGLAPRNPMSRTEYWNAPVPGFGDPGARVLLVGLAPGAHGANRTGRPFTGDGAGDFMYPLLHEAGFAGRAESRHREDGFRLKDLYISNAVKCAPPGNRPENAEFTQCRPFLEEEIAALPGLQVILLLGQGAFSSYLRLLKDKGIIEKMTDFPFVHGRVYQPSQGPCLIASYHTSRYNIQTGRMTTEMFLSVLEKIRELLVSGENR